MKKWCHYCKDMLNVTEEVVSLLPVETRFAETLGPREVIITHCATCGRILGENNKEEGVKALRVVTGSLADISAQDGCSLAESFIGADAVVLIDVSGSMGNSDSRGGQSRYAVACEELTQLQANLPGRCAMIAFSTRHQFCPGGIPTFLGAGTNLTGALRFAKLADVEDMRFYVISDGQPNDRIEALAVAATIKSPIYTIYVGPEGGSGMHFLERLAKANGGKAEVDFKVMELANKVERLMLGG